MNQTQRVVALPFRVAIGFLLLLLLWTFLFDSAALAPDPVSYEVEEKMRQNHVSPAPATKAVSSFVPWRRTVLNRHQQHNHQHLPLGSRVEMYNLQTRQDLNSQVGRIIAFDGGSALYTVRLRHGIGQFRLRPENVRLRGTPSHSTPADAAKSARHHHDTRRRGLQTKKQIVTCGALFLVACLVLQCMNMCCFQSSDTSREENNAETTAEFGRFHELSPIRIRLKPLADFLRASETSAADSCATTGKIGEEDRAAGSGKVDAASDAPGNNHAEKRHGYTLAEEEIREVLRTMDEKKEKP